MSRIWKPSKPAESKTTLEHIMPVVPAILWIAVAIAALFIFQQNVAELLQRTTKFKALGLELEAAERSIAKSVASVQRIPDQGAHLRLSADDPLRSSLVQRWHQMNMSVQKLRILLIHDKLRVAKALQKPFADLGFTVDIGICGAEAESLMTRHQYDVVISDINWRDCKDGIHPTTDGIAFLKYAHEHGFAQPTIFYIEHLDISKGTPAYAAGITNNWYEVLHYVLDVVSRKATTSTAD